jgi:hypothetical protein
MYMRGEIYKEPLEKYIKATDYYQMSPKRQGKILIHLINVMVAPGRPFRIRNI